MPQNKFIFTVAEPRSSFDLAVFQTPDCGTVKMKDLVHKKVMITS
jgi:hypothetical protein